MTIHGRLDQGNFPRHYALELEADTSTLRDIFAAFALAGLADHFATPGDTFAELVAAHAYEYADAMMKARATNQQGSHE